MYQISRRPLALALSTLRTHHKYLPTSRGLVRWLGAPVYTHHSIRPGQIRLSRATFSTSTQSKHYFGEDFDPYNYTKGRWLRNDAIERKARFIQFDFDALCRKIIALCPGARSITSCEKIEGGSNRVFIFHTDNGERLVAKLPFSVAGPPRYTTGSEVATVEYLQAKTSIPIPKILDWSDDASNAIGSEYIIMEHAPGVCLASKWHEMTEVQRTLCMEPIYQKMKEAANLAFPAYGSIYRTDTPYIEGSTIPLDSNFCIGPSCENLYWNCSPTSPKYHHDIKPNRGPWPDLPSFSSALTDVGISRLPPASIASSLRLPAYHGTISEHKVLLEYCRAITKQMIQTTLMQTVSTPILFHPDLHSRNIFVSEEDPTVLTAILDWQSSAIQPAFWYVDSTPDFAQKEAVGVDAEDDGQGGAGDQGQDQAQKQEQKQKQPKYTPSSTLRAEAFDHLIRSQLPHAMTIPRTMNEAYLRPFTYGHRSWLHGATPFREELIQTSRRWGELGFSTVGPCAYPMPSREEYAAHWERYKEFEARHTFKLELERVLGVQSGGWVWADMYDVTDKAQKEWFEEAMVGAVGERGERVWVSEDGERLTEAEIRDTWPFDLED